MMTKAILLLTVALIGISASAQEDQSLANMKDYKVPPPELKVAPTGDKANDFRAAMSLQSSMVGYSKDDAEMTKRIQYMGQLSDLFTKSLAEAGKKTSTTFPFVSESIRMNTAFSRREYEGPKSDAVSGLEQTHLLSLTALQNARLIEQNDQIIALLKQIANKK